MNTVSPKTEFDFMGKRYLAMALSAIVIIAGVVGLAIRGLNFGIDFTGGVVIEVGYRQAADLVDIRDRLAESGYSDAQVQNFGTSRDVMIRVLPREGVDYSKVGDAIFAVLQEGSKSAELRRVEFVGPQVGEELTERGGLAMLFSLIMILIYIIFRFQWKFAIGAVAALIHDVVITVGVFALLQIPFDLSVLAALLAVIGYSLNDTIVVFDRIRENFRRIRKQSALQIVNLSLNQTLSRTIVTGLTTLLVLVALLLLGGEAVSGFSIALIIGIVVGTYSSIYTASAIALVLNVSPVDLMPPEKGETVDNMP